MLLFMSILRLKIPNAFSDDKQLLITMCAEFMKLDNQRLAPQIDKGNFPENSTNIGDDEAPWYKFKVQYDARKQIKRRLSRQRY